MNKKIPNMKKVERIFNLILGILIGLLIAFLVIGSNQSEAYNKGIDDCVKGKLEMREYSK